MGFKFDFNFWNNSEQVTKDFGYEIYIRDLFYKLGGMIYWGFPFYILQNISFIFEVGFFYKDSSTNVL